MGYRVCTTPQAVRILILTKAWKSRRTLGERVKGLLFCFGFFPRKSGSPKAGYVTETELFGCAVLPAWGAQPGGDWVCYSNREETMRKKYSLSCF